VVWRSITIAMAVSGFVVLGALLAIGEWGCCGGRVAKPVTGDSTWVRPPNPWISGEAALSRPAVKSGPISRASRGDSGATDANPLSVLSALKPQGKGNRPSLPNDSGPTVGTPLPPVGTGPPPTDTKPTDNCSSVVDVLTGLAAADCGQREGSSDNDDFSGNHDSANHHSSNQNDSSDNGSADATTLAASAQANDNAGGSNKGKNDHGAKSHGAKSKGHGRAVGNKHR
jgi:hypothetical protein